MKRKQICLAVLSVFFLTLFTTADFGWCDSSTAEIKLPGSKYDGTVSVEKALKERRSVRSYKDVPLSMEEVSQVLWAAQGITEPSRGLRTAPSARAQYFLTVYLLAGNVTGLKPAMYRYEPARHSLAVVDGRDMKGVLYKAVGQSPVQKAPIALVITGAQDRATNTNWMYLEAGHAAQNIYLQAVSLGLGTVVMGGFDPEAVRTACGFSVSQRPLYIMPVGRK